MTAWEIRKEWPSPIPYPLNGAQDCPDGYCVGGAVGFTLGFEDGYPETSDVAMYLSMLNGNLDEGMADEFARDITSLNDEGYVMGAWSMLDAALSYA